MGCCELICLKTYHLPCGIKNGAVNEYYGNFNSYCPNHKQKRTISDNYILTDLGLVPERVDHAANDQADSKAWVYKVPYNLTFCPTPIKKKKILPEISVPFPFFPLDILPNIILYREDDMASPFPFFPRYVLPHGPQPMIFPSLLPNLIFFPSRFDKLPAPSPRGGISNFIHACSKEICDKTVNSRSKFGKQKKKSLTVHKETLVVNEDHNDLKQAKPKVHKSSRAGSQRGDSRGKLYRKRVVSRPKESKT